MQAERDRPVQAERERVGGLGRSLGDVLAGGRPSSEARTSALFDGVRPEVGQLDEVLDALAAAFPDDVTGTCLHEAGSPSVTRARAGHAVDAELWVLTDVLRASVGTDELLVLDQPALGTAVLAAPVGTSGALAVLRRGGAFSARDRLLVDALARVATR